MTTIVDKSGRVLIPRPLRDRLGLTPGTELILHVLEGGDGAPALEIRAVANARDESQRGFSVSGLDALPPLPLNELVGSAPSGRTAEEVDRELRQLRDEWD